MSNPKNPFRMNDEPLNDEEFKQLIKYLSQQANNRGKSIGYFAMMELDNEICLSISATDSKIKNMFYTLFEDNESIRDLAAEVMSNVILNRIDDPQNKTDAALKLARERFKKFLQKEKEKSPEEITRELLSDPDFNLGDYVTPVGKEREASSNPNDDVNDVDSLLDKLGKTSNPDDKQKIIDLMDKLNIGTSDEESKK